ncbi:gp81 [Brochothrix phage A9]|uniref:Gp81 n=1 Tax=Brochothrix phage A9 TaxID=857312 RepID=D9J0M8_9CAUD|nr:gp81 [Brochothrix phage A9]ADJ53121.1 gp81 [Brochothrix phage A9]
MPLILSCWLPLITVSLSLLYYFIKEIQLIRLPITFTPLLVVCSLISCNVILSYQHFTFKVYYKLLGELTVKCSSLFFILLGGLF